jgi:sec-independent protein translocase protein TatA
MINAMLAIFNLGGGEIILILALVLILFGARKLPELAKGLGQGIKEFKKATREVTDEVQRAADDNHYTPPSPAAPKQIQESVEPEKAAAAAQTSDKKA